MVKWHIESSCTPRSYVVATDVDAGISGARARLDTRPKAALDQALPLMKVLYPLDPAADMEFVDALKDLAASQLTQLVNELAFLGGPRVVRVHQYFQMLLGIRIRVSAGSTTASPSIHIRRHLAPGEPPPPADMRRVWAEPDGVLGTL